jgi:hypothetical protein
VLADSHGHPHQALCKNDPISDGCGRHW